MRECYTQEKHQQRETKGNLVERVRNSLSVLLTYILLQQMAN